ncbi:hypothetical protein D9757_000467 [Collybiopsis confluens]|uniref:Uncharacterized protein n=1 Tax=Collybiopsis confluens TaxID=2823264 RepID=A0A8H5MGP3_9AGAR|nr:hypothetical protein D9757_000467 [Collybiopsis confluens]
MRFSTLSVLATIASAAFSFAAPETRAVDPSQTIQGQTTLLNASASALGPLANQINAVVNQATANVTGLSGEPLANILSDGNGGELTPDQVTQLGFGIANSALKAVAAVLNLVGSAGIASLRNLITSCILAFASLALAIFNLIPGVLASAITTAGSGLLTNFISELSLTTLISFFFASVCVNGTVTIKLFPPSRLRQLCKYPSGTRF